MVCGVVLALGVGVDDARAWSIWTHWDMTDEELTSQGWGEDARNVVIDCNMATDLLASNWSLFFPDSSARMDDVEALIADAPFNTDGSDGFHFDNLDSYDEIEARWEAFAAWAEAEVDEMVEEGWGDESREEFLCLLGVVHHAVQDFYAHSNWVKLTNEHVAEPYDEDTEEEDVNSDQYPTWDDLHAEGEWGGWADGTSDADVTGHLQQSNQNPGSGTENGPDDGLQTGEYPDEDGGPWDHRHPDDAEGAVAEALSIRASAQWKHTLLDYLDEACRENVLDYVTTANSGETVQRVDQTAVGTYVDVLESQLGTLAPAEQVHAVISAGELISRHDLVGELLVDFSRGIFPGATIEVFAASEQVIQEVLTAPDPEAAAQAAVEDGTLVIRRLEPVPVQPDATVEPAA